MDSSSSAIPGNDGDGHGMMISQDSKQDLQPVIKSTQKTLEILHQLYLNVSSFKVACQLPLLQRMNDLVSEFDHLSKLAKGLNNIEVPLEVINLIDDGKNPDQFTKDVLDTCVAKNQMTQGKIDAMSSFVEHLSQELEQNYFSDELEASADESEVLQGGR